MLLFNIPVAETATWKILFFSLGIFATGGQAGCKDCKFENQLRLSWKKCNTIKDCLHFQNSIIELPSISSSKWALCQNRKVGY